VPVSAEEYCCWPNSKCAMIHPDHLATPQKMSDAAGVVVWSADYKPFGEATVNPSSTITNNLRFPGQYYDAETGNHYNYYRDYDPAIGKYKQADPIGIALGSNHIYVYGNNNPLKNVDVYGKNPAAAVFMILVEMAEWLGPGVIFLVPLELPGDISKSRDAIDTKTCHQTPDSSDCKVKLSNWQVKKLLNLDAHQVKYDYVGKNASVKLYDLCRCKSGAIVVRLRGCVGPIIPTDFSM
jgi:RHS repeat-associated protein